MIEKLIALLGALIKSTIDAGGYTGIMALLVLNSSGIPIPSEVILPFSGYLVYLGRFNLLFVVLAAVIGCNIGSAIAYWIGAKGGRPLVERYGKWVLMSEHDLDRMVWFFNRYGSIAILVGRMLPIVQTYVAFPAGIARMSRLRFHIYTTVGSLIWYTCLAWAGMKLGAHGILTRACTSGSIASTLLCLRHWPQQLSGLSGVISSERAHRNHS